MYVLRRERRGRWRQLQILEEPPPGYRTASCYTVHLRKSSGSRLAGTCSVKQRNCICHCTESSVNPRTVQQIYSGRVMFRRFTEHVPASLQRCRNFSVNWQKFFRQCSCMFQWSETSSSPCSVLLRGFVVGFGRVPYRVPRTINTPTIRGNLPLSSSQACIATLIFHVLLLLCVRSSK